MRATALQKSLRVLELFEERTSLRFSEIQKRVATSPATLSAMLDLLVSHRFLEKTGSGYVLGTRVLTLAMALLDRMEVRQIAMPYLYELRDDTGATVELSVPDGRALVIVEKIEAPQPVALNSCLGLRLANLHIIAPGKIILAHGDTAFRRAVYASDAFQLKPVDLDRLEAEYGAILAENRASDHQQTFNGISRVASPILNCDGSIAALISIPQRTADATASVLRERQQHIHAVARTLSRKMGFNGHF